MEFLMKDSERTASLGTIEPQATNDQMDMKKQCKTHKKLAEIENQCKTCKKFYRDVPT
jgi:hypothetical protein